MGADMIYNNFNAIAIAQYSSSVTMGNMASEVKDAWSKLLLDNDVRINCPAHNILNLKKELLDIASELIELCVRKNLQVDPTILADIPKNLAWFGVFIRFCFSGMKIDNYSAKELGLDGVNQINDEHEVYLSIINHLRSVGDIRNEKNFEQFMSWLVKLDFIEDMKNESIIENVPGWQKSMQPELCRLATDVDRSNRKGFDPNWHGNMENLNIYKGRHAFMKQNILEAIIAEAPKELVVKLFKHWLNNEGISKRLFMQNHYPLNMLLNEHCAWNVLLCGLPKILPDTNGKIKNEFAQCDGTNESVECSQEGNQKWVSSWSNVFGRTLISKSVENRYLKIQSRRESDINFKKGYERLKHIRKLSSELGLRSLMPTPKKIMRIMAPYDLYDSAVSESYTCSSNKIFTEKVSQHPCLAMEFTTPIDIPYEEYVYDVADDLSVITSLSKYAADYGKLWKYGLLPPSCLSAFHDTERNRMHNMLSPFFERMCEGSIENWNGQATNYPNIGGPKMGMRDKVDITIPEEKSDCYFGRFLRNASSLDSIDHCNKIRYEEISKAAQGICLLYARRFNSMFDHNSKENIEQIKKDISGLLTDLFSNAFPLSKSNCNRLMQDHDLLNQCCREISYWLAKNTTYVDDLRKGDINRKVYPHLPQEMQGCILTELQSDCLTDDGFVDASKSKTKRGSCQLGSQSGRMPLIALNALVVKMLSHGTIKNIEIESLKAS
ncbi:MAG: hypothetical protein QS721_03810 [Candidatus Endonucleobacter sp. (ex Gigantidas childressi)]|nr:hypothetical protein [Candidatus Endonucleobacter sp. (ex Gigantidas childressi)]